MLLAPNGFRYTPEGYKVSQTYKYSIISGNSLQAKISLAVIFIPKKEDDTMKIEKLPSGSYRIRKTYKGQVYTVIFELQTYTKGGHAGHGERTGQGTEKAYQHDL